MALTFQKATKKRARLRAALVGPAGSGKTLTSLKLAMCLGERIAVIDTERGSASKYADKFSFDVLELDGFSPDVYVDAIKAAERAGYDVIIVDSLSHAWSGSEGALEQVDDNMAKYKGNRFAAWRDITPKHNALVDAMVGSKCHIIATMRAKMAYEIVEENGKKRPVKIGLAPVQREGVEYEFDVVGDIDQDHKLIVSKSRCDAIADKVFTKPGEDLGRALRDWLTDGVEPPAPPKAEPRPVAQPAPATNDEPLLVPPEQLSGHAIDLLEAAADGAARLAIVNGAMQAGMARSELATVLESALLRADGERGELAKIVAAAHFDEPTRARLRAAFARGKDAAQ